MRSIFIYFFCIVGLSIWFSFILNANQPKNEIKVIPVRNKQSERLLNNKVKNMLSKFVTQQKINELGTQAIEENIDFIKKTQTHKKNEYSYQKDDRYYAEWH